LSLPAVATYTQRDLPLTGYRNQLAGVDVTFLRQESLQQDLQRVHPRFSNIVLGGQVYTHPYSPYPQREWKRYFEESPQLHERLVAMLRGDLYWLRDYYSEDLTDESYIT
jgi:hypothetical protein